MLFRTLLLGFLLPVFAINCEERYSRAIFSKILNHFNENSSNKANRFNKKISFNTSQEYVKGYSLKIPKTKFPTKHQTSNNISIEETRTKRGVFHLYNIIQCATGCNPLSYKGYGCFCGLFGSGAPVDGIDKCCKMHDWCYDIANCPMYLEYFVPYYWKCYYNTPFCAIDHGEFGAPGSCADMLCECDKALAECLKKYPCPERRAICKSAPFRFLQNVFMALT